MFSEAEEILYEHVEHACFPVQKYKIYVFLAVINKRRGDDVKVQKYRELAKQNSDAETSGFRYHKTLGLVEESDRRLEQLLKL